MLADGFASASFGGAIAVAVYHLLALLTVQPAVIACAAAAGLAAYCTSRWLLHRIGRREPAGRMADAAPPNHCAAAATRDSQSNREFDSAVVVRLFDPADTVPDASSDASQSLHHALHQLRQSLANRR